MFPAPFSAVGGLLEFGTLNCMNALISLMAGKAQIFSPVDRGTSVVFGSAPSSAAARGTPKPVEPPGGSFHRAILQRAPPPPPPQAHGSNPHTSLYFFGRGVEGGKFFKIQKTCTSFYTYFFSVYLALVSNAFAVGLPGNLPTRAQNTFYAEFKKISQLGF